jgi:Ser-tRNA(Ala) deacylase AlaX
MDSSTLITCQKNSYLKESFNQVLLCEPYPASDNYRIILDDSILYPEGGGQPYDLGTVNNIPVIKVAKPELSGSFPPTAVEIALPHPISIGSTVQCIVDWDRRYDFMQQHTAQVRKESLSPITNRLIFCCFMIAFV